MRVVVEAMKMDETLQKQPVMRGGQEGSWETWTWGRGDRGTWGRGL